MLVSPVSSYGAAGIDATYRVAAKKSDTPVKAVQAPVKKAYQVTLTSQAKAKSLELEGYSVAMIAARLGLSVNVVEQYLGVTASAADSAFKSTYVAPKSTYVTPKAPYSEPDAITKGRDQLASDLTQLPLVQYNSSLLIGSAAKTVT